MSKIEKRHKMYLLGGTNKVEEQGHKITNYKFVPLPISGIILNLE